MQISKLKKYIISLYCIFLLINITFIGILIFDSVNDNGCVEAATIIVDPKKVGDGNIVMMGIRIVQPYSDSIINMIKKIPGACVVTRTIGEYDIEAIFLLKNIEQIGSAKETIEDLPQVKGVNIGILVDKPLLCPKNFEFDS